jgi:hypothetical protein
LDDGEQLVDFDVEHYIDPSSPVDERLRSLVCDDKPIFPSFENIGDMSLMDFAKQKL